MTDSEHCNVCLYNTAKYRSMHHHACCTCIFNNVKRHSNFVPEDSGIERVANRCIGCGKEMDSVFSVCKRCGRIIDNFFDAKARTEEGLLMIIRMAFYINKEAFDELEAEMMTWRSTH